MSKRGRLFRQEAGSKKRPKGGLGTGQLVQEMSRRAGVVYGYIDMVGCGVKVGLESWFGLHSDVADPLRPAIEDHEDIDMLVSPDPSIGVGSQPDGVIAIGPGRVGHQ